MFFIIIIICISNINLIDKLFWTLISRTESFCFWDFLSFETYTSSQGQKIIILDSLPRVNQLENFFVCQPHANLKYDVLNFPQSTFIFL